MASAEHNASGPQSQAGPNTEGEHEYLVIGADEPVMHAICHSLARSGSRLLMTGSDVDRLTALDASLVQSELHRFAATPDLEHLVRGCVATSAVIAADHEQTDETAHHLLRTLADSGFEHLLLVDVWDRLLEPQAETEVALCRARLQRRMGAALRLRCRVNAVCVRALLNEDDELLLDEMKQARPDRALRPSDVASTVRALLGPPGSYMIGQLLVLDGRG